MFILIMPHLCVLFLPLLTLIIRNWLNIGPDIWLEKVNLEAEVTMCWYDARQPPAIMLMMLTLMMMLAAL